jgi:hypothetical protein
MAVSYQFTQITLNYCLFVIASDRAGWMTVNYYRLLRTRVSLTHTEGVV